MKKYLLLIGIVLLVTGCSSYTELNELSIVDTLGIDYVDNEYHLVINVVNGKLDDDKVEEEITTYQTSGTTLEECFHEIYLQSPKKLYLSHIDLLILTNSSIDNKFQEIIYNFLNNNEYRNNFNVVLLKDISIEEFMNKQIPSKTVNGLIKTNHKETGITKPQDLETIMQEVLIDKNTYLPIISFDEDIIASGFMLIKDYHIFEELTKKESIILNLLHNEIKKTYINNNNIVDNQTVITTKNNNITINFITTIMEDNNYKLLIKEDIINFLNKFKLKNYDILKLCEKVRKNNYYYYKNENNLLSKLNYNINFHITIKENYLQGDLYETR